MSEKKIYLQIEGTVLSYFFYEIRIKLLPVGSTALFIKFCLGMYMCNQVIVIKLKYFKISFDC